MTFDPCDQALRSSLTNRLETLRHARYWSSVTGIEEALHQLQPNLRNLIALLEEIELPKPVNVGLDSSDALDVALLDQAVANLSHLATLARQHDETTPNE